MGKVQRELGSSLGQFGGVVNRELPKPDSGSVKAVDTPSASSMV